MRLAFLDLETVGLADDCDVWEIGLIVREPAPVDSPDGVVHVDTEYSWQIRPNLYNAEPTGLRIGRFYERMDRTLLNYPEGYGGLTTPGASSEGRTPVTEAKFIALDVAKLLDGATIVGAVPDFDDRHLRRFLRDNGQAGTWHYHLCDFETLIVGYLAGQGTVMPPPWRSEELSRAIGVEPPGPDERHTALGDAKWAVRVWDRVSG